MIIITPPPKVVFAGISYNSENYDTEVNNNITKEEAGNECKKKQVIPLLV